MRTRVISVLLGLMVGPPPPVAAEPLPGADAPPAALSSRLERSRSEAGPDPRTRHRDPSGRPIFVNRLALEPSPYLQQHAYNPVNWFPWGEEAFARARSLGRPVMLSVGYSTCHWCHVMEEESFEDPEIAEYLNRHFVAIKVDREERPDIDALYMAAVSAMTGSGGWPMTVFVTSEGQPFFGGTYFPPRDSPGLRRPGFLSVLRRIQQLYSSDPTAVAARAGAVAASLGEMLAPEPAVGVAGPAEIRAALESYRQRFDSAQGGLRRRTKFPSSLSISLLLRAHRRTGAANWLEMATQTLDAMRRGGIYDQVGGGFHRYTVEPTWTVPHFEKMLYDNALLVRAYVGAWQVTGDPAYEQVVRDVLAYVAREMTSPDGSFYSATDADSEGEEGRFFVWTREALASAAGDEAELARAAYGVNGQPNFEGQFFVLRRDLSIAELATRLGREPAAVEQALVSVRSRLYSARSSRPPPLRDDKQLVAWNGLMISAFARAGAAFREPSLLALGGQAASTLLARAHSNGKLARYLKDGEAHGAGVLDDYAYLIAGLVDLYEASGESRWLTSATELQAEQDRRFLDDLNGGYWMTASDAGPLVARQKPGTDSARPGANAVAAENLLRLYHLTSDSQHRERAEMTLRVFSERIAAQPSSFARMLEAADFLFDTPKEILIVTPETREQAEPFLAELGRRYLPNRVLGVATEAQSRALEELVPLFEDKRALGGKATAYVCENRVCQLPARDPAQFARQLDAPAHPWPDSASR